MKRIENYSEFKKVSGDLARAAGARSSKVLIRIAMATCSIASGSAPVLETFRDRMPKQPLEYEIIPTGCLGLCHSEPTVEVTLPGKEPVVFGKVDANKAEDIINEYIVNGRNADGILKEVSE